MTGYIQIKEYQMWGKSATYKNYETGDILYTSYRDDKTLVPWETMKKELRDLWRPVASEEVTWFENNIN